MLVSDIFLVIVSGLGVIHGLFLAAFLWIYKKGRTLSNRMLSILLLVLSFRVGKSVFLEFADNLHVKLIFIGLGTLMAIGPLYYLFVQSCSDRSFQFRQKHLVHFIPAVLGICFGLWIDEGHLNTLPMLLFIAVFASYYGHYLVYLIISRSYMLKQSRAGLNKDVHNLLTLMFYGLLVIWVAYVLNLLDDIVPYVIGPVLYSIVAYVISFIVIQKGYIQKIDQHKYKTTPLPDEQIDRIFQKILELIEKDKQYKQPDISLNSLSQTLNVSPQVLSMVINQKSKKNFNAFINHYRIEESIQRLQDKQHKNHTIAAIAFEVGFNSISSFNTAFKNHTNKTPAAFRKQLTK